MVLLFKTQELDLDHNSTEASLECEANDGMKIVGTDSVNIVPKGKAYNKKKTKKYGKKGKKGKAYSKKIEMHGKLEKKNK